MELAPEYSVPLLPKAQLSLVTGLADLLRTIEDAVGAAALDWCLKNDVDHVDQIVAVGAKEEERFVREVGVQPDGVKARLLRRRLEERRRLLRAGV
jgi:malonyl CoA-acyl carrier protein transacylase